MREESYSDSSCSSEYAKSQEDLTYKFEEVNRDKNKEQEVEMLANDVKKLYDKKIKDLKAKEYEPDTVTEFDKLRKRV